MTLILDEIAGLPHPRPRPPHAARIRAWPASAGRSAPSPGSTRTLEDWGREAEARGARSPASSCARPGSPRGVVRQQARLLAALARLAAGEPVTRSRWIWATSPLGLRCHVQSARWARAAEPLSRELIASDFTHDSRRSPAAMHVPSTRARGYRLVPCPDGARELRPATSAPERTDCPFATHCRSCSTRTAVPGARSMGTSRAPATHARSLPRDARRWPCSGPHAYVSPGWYRTHPSVPTRNYRGGACHGSARC